MDASNQDAVYCSCPAAIQNFAENLLEPVFTRTWVHGPNQREPVPQRSGIQQVFMEWLCDALSRRVRSTCIVIHINHNLSRTNVEQNDVLFNFTNYINSIDIYCSTGGIVLFFGHAGLSLEKPNKKKERIQTDASNFYQHAKWSKPLDKQTLNAVKVMSEAGYAPNHKEFLKRQVSRLEANYSNSGMDNMHFPQIANINVDDGDGIDTLFDHPQKYKDVCKYIGQSPIQELLEDWRENIKRLNDWYAELEERRLTAQKLDDEKIIEIKNTIKHLTKQKWERRDIISELKVRYQKETYFKVSRENGLWKVEVGYAKSRFRV